MSNAPGLHDRYRSLLLWADRPAADRAPAARALHRLVRLLLITVTEFQRNALSIRSGAITYTVLLSLVPILAMSTAVIKGFGGGDHLRQAAYGYLESLEGRYPQPAGGTAGESASATAEAADASLTGHLRSAVDQLFDYVDKTDFAAIGTFGLLGILVSVVLVLGSIESALNAIWNVAAGRSMARKIADYLTLLILMPLSVNITFAAGTLLQNPTLAAYIDTLIPLPWLQTLLLKALPVVVTTFTLYVMYIFFPNTRVKNRPAMLGASLAALMWFTVQNIYISLQIGVAGYNAIYGSFATVPLFLAWIYLGWMFILAGAQLAFAAQAIDVHQLVPHAAAPALRLAAAFDVVDCLYRLFAENRKLTPAHLGELLPGYPPQLLAETVAVLRSAGIVHLSRSDNRLLPGMAREHYRPEEVIGRILGTEAPASAGGRMSSAAIAAAMQASAAPSAPTAAGRDGEAGG